MAGAGDRSGGGGGPGPAQAAPRLRVLPGGAGEAQRDDALVRAFLVGDDEAFEELWHRHEATVHAVVRRYARDPEDGRDLVQRAFLRALTAARKALARAPAAAATPFPFRPWLLRIAVNLGKNHARDRRRWPSESLESVRHAASETPAADEALLRRERERLVRAAVLGLPRRQREVLSLRIDAGLPFAEVAEVLAITENNAKVHFHHATRRLRDLCREEEP
jgi:RNA polymerase sigma-70 factor (ECF subfamily)